MGKLFSAALLLIFIGGKVSGAQNLSPGDIAIVGLNALNPDEFAFVLLVDIPAGTQITFADHGWHAAGSLRATEDEFVYTAANTVAREQVVLAPRNARVELPGGTAFEATRDVVFRWSSDPTKIEFDLAQGLTTANVSYLKAPHCGGRHPAPSGPEKAYV